MNEPQPAPENASGSVPAAGAHATPPATVPAGNNGGATYTHEQLEAARNAAAAETRRAIEADQTEKARKAEDARKQAEQVAKGKFDDVLASVTTERDTVTAQRDALATALEGVIKARLETVPADKRADVRKLIPASATLPEQLVAVEAAISLLGAQAPAPRGAGGNPPRAGSADERANQVDEIRRSGKQTGAYAPM